MRYLLMVLLLVSFGSAGAVEIQRFRGSPKGWVEKFPLGEATESDLTRDLGIPDKSLTSGDLKMIAYTITTGAGAYSRTITYTFTIRSDGLVTKVVVDGTGFIGTGRIERNLE